MRAGRWDRDLGCTLHAHGIAAAASPVRHGISNLKGARSRSAAAMRTIWGGACADAATNPAGFLAEGTELCDGFWQELLPCVHPDHVLQKASTVSGHKRIRTLTHGALQDAPRRTTASILHGSPAVDGATSHIFGTHVDVSGILGATGHTSRMAHPGGGG